MTASVSAALDPSPYLVTPCTDEDLLNGLHLALGDEGSVVIEKTPRAWLCILAVAQYGELGVKKRGYGSELRLVLQSVAFRKFALDSAVIQPKAYDSLSTSLWTYLEPCLNLDNSKLTVIRRRSDAVNEFPFLSHSYEAILDTPFTTALGTGNTLYDVLCDALKHQALATMYRQVP